MSVNRRVIPIALLGALLVACNTAPTSPVEPASQSPSPSPTVTPAPTATAASSSPSPTPTPSPSPSYSSGGGSSTPIKVYGEADLGGLGISSVSYRVTPTDAPPYHGQARMNIRINGETRTVQFEELDLDDESDGFDTLKVTDGDNVRTFGADQEFVNFWVSMPSPSPSLPPENYRVQSADASPIAPTTPPDGSLEILALQNGTYMLGRGEFAPATDLARTATDCLSFPEFRDASLASLSGIYAAMRARESKFEPEPSALPGEYRLRSFRSGHTRFPIPPSSLYKQGRPGINFKYRVLDSETPAPTPPPTLNAGAALLQEIIRQRLDPPPTPQ